jgi:kynurenine formamidase
LTIRPNKKGNIVAVDINTDDDLKRMLSEGSNWGRWGADDQLGLINLITPEKRREAASLVRSGRAVSLSRPFPKTPSPENPNPAQHWMRFSASGSTDYIAIAFHGTAATHLDALCHMWGPDGLFNGGDPSLITPAGAGWGSVDNWSDGIVTRGVLLDIPKLRGKPYVTQDDPVRGIELEQAAVKQGVIITPGDAVAVYSGREEYSRVEGPWGASRQQRPGLHASCLGPLREWDASVLIWDMMDAFPSGFSNNLPVHAAIYTFGLALVDNSLLEPLAAACAEEGRYDFMVAVAPLVVVGGTGSPVNPIAIF